MWLRRPRLLVVHFSKLYLSWEKRLGKVYYREHTQGSFDWKLKPNERARHIVAGGRTLWWDQAKKNRGMWYDIKFKKCGMCILLFSSVFHYHQKQSWQSNQLIHIQLFQTIVSLWMQSHWATTSEVTTQPLWSCICKSINKPPKFDSQNWMVWLWVTSLDSWGLGKQWRLGCWGSLLRASLVCRFRAPESQQQHIRVRVRVSYAFK